VSNNSYESSDSDEFASGRAEAPSESIICVDCGGRAHLLSHPPEDGVWQIGEVVAYRCSDCRDRWDIVLAPEGQ